MGRPATRVRDAIPDEYEPAASLATGEPAGRHGIAEAVARARRKLLADQAPDGHWHFQLEADATIPAEYILLEHFLDDIDAPLQNKLAVYLRETQGAHGGWPLFHAGDFDMSASVKAYYALKLTGDDTNAPHMRRAREAILAHGGAARSNVFTRIALALFGQVPWRAVPTMPVEIMLLPRWFPFHLSKIAYWSRTVLVPLLILMAEKPRARNPRGVGIAELFTTPPWEERDFLVNPTGERLGALLLEVDKLLRRLEPVLPRPWKERALRRAVAFITERLNGEDGLGGIFPAMANSVMALDVLGYPRDHPDYLTARAALRKLLVVEEDRAYCQSCLSPVWDTALAMHGLLEAGEAENSPALQKAADWLADRQILDVKGDWAEKRPDLEPGGWAFQYGNAHYPDTDDTAVVVMALERAGGPRTEEAVRRGVEWIVGMQSANGGWGAFDADNAYHYLDNIPFADHGALLDPPSADVTARCLGMLVQCGYDPRHAAVAPALDYLRRVQEPDGSWFGRWGTNYVYGTWSVLSALNAAGEDPEAPHIQKAVAWLKARQLPDGGWGEDCATYWLERKDEVKGATPTQTAWALLGLMAAGEVDSEAARRGVCYLLDTLGSDGAWEDSYFNAVGFPRVFYLKYHGYARYFPLWALARYLNLTGGNRRTSPYGI